MILCTKVLSCFVYFSYVTDLDCVRARWGLESWTPGHANDAECIKMSVYLLMNGKEWAMLYQQVSKPAEKQADSTPFSHSSSYISQSPQEGWLEPAVSGQFVYPLPSPMWEWQLLTWWECVWKGIFGIFSPVLLYDIDYRGSVIIIKVCCFHGKELHTCHCHLCIIMWNKLCIYSTLTVCMCVCACVYGCVSDAVVSVVQCWRAGG